MTEHFRPSYRLQILPVSGTVTAWRGAHVLARSDNARVMFETRLEPVLYFPWEDVTGVSGTPGERRTFCPFKGTAVYHDLTIGGERLADAVWSYPRTLRESRGFEGCLAFMPGIVEAFDTPHGLPRPAADGHISSPIVDWLLREAWTIADPAELVREVAHRFMREGIAVWRLNVTMWSLHPQIAGASYVWRRETDEVAVDRARHEMLASDAFVNSPIRYVSEGLGGVRQPLDTGDAEFSFPIMDDLKAEGATDYVAMPLPFSDGRINVMTMATDHPKGFTTANLGLVFECSAVISRYLEVMSLRMNARTLLQTYLGKRTGARVLGGEIRRGDGDEIDAAILFCDLRGSSRLSEELSTEAYLALLNRFFETVTNVVESHGGEVLKFIGDAVLAVFPVDRDEPAAGTRAIDASRDILASLRELNSESDAAGIACALGACFGRVTYGNVGSADRLDFTVTGAAANIAARLSDLCKVLDRPALFSDALVSHVDAPMVSLGRHRLHNVNREIEVFAPDQTAG